MGKTLRFVLGDQLSRDISSLNDIDAANDVIFMAEVAQEATNVRHHKQKIIFVFSAMRHFAEELRAKGFTVDYVKLDDAGNTQSLTGELQRAINRQSATHVVVTEPSEWRVAEDVKSWTRFTSLDIRADDRFIATHNEFECWAQGRKQLRMEYFYRKMRLKTGYLLEQGKPAGGEWNYDSENRKRLPKDATVPKRHAIAPDRITHDVISLVEQRFADHFGKSTPFRWAVTREGALQALDYFITHALPHFGDYQDAMKHGEDFVYHSLLSPYINFGLLTPREVCDRAQAAWLNGDVELNAAEGFIRQIIGWREYVRGIYWLKMPDYAQSNFLNATRPLPWFYWSGETTMNCMRQCLNNTINNAYAHHIQRLMVLGNFALLAGVAPAEIEEWFLVVYADALDWVELPNVHGMVMHADGGLLGSKPYAASGAYINRMSDYCAGCSYDHKASVGPKACPFNYLYWNFLMENEEKLASNPRMAMPYRNVARMDEGKKQALRERAQKFLATLN